MTPYPYWSEHGHCQPNAPPPPPPPPPPQPQPERPTAVCIVRQQSQQRFELEAILALGVITRISSSCQPDLIFIKDGLRLSFFVTMPPPPGFDFLAPLLHNDLRARVAACADASPPFLPPLLVVPLAWSHLSEFARLCASDPITQKARLCPLITQPITPASATSAVLLLADQIFRMMGASCGGGGGDGAGATAAAKAAAASPAACLGVLQALAAAATAAAGRPSSGPGLATRLARVMSVTVGRSLADLVALLGAREGEAVGPAAAAAAALLSLEERTALRELLL